MSVNKKLSNSIYLCNNLTYNLQNVLYSKKFSLHFKSFCRIKENSLRSDRLIFVIIP